MLLTVLVYWGVWHGYFQQDEWSGFGRVAVGQEQGFSDLIRFSGLHFTPFTIFFVALLFSFFELNHVPYGIFSIFLHGANVCLVYLLTLLMGKSKKIALVSAIIFLISFTPYQTITWYAASMSFLPSTFLALLGLIAFEYYLKNGKKFWLLYALFFITLSAGFRENTIVLLLYFLFCSRHIWPAILATGSVYMGLRFLPLLFNTRLTTVAPHTSSFPLYDIALQGITFVLFFLPRLFIPTPIPVYIGKIIFGASASFAQEWILNIFYLVVWIFVILVGTFVKKSFDIKRLIVFIFLSIAPLAFLPIPYIMESRHYYLTNIGFSILVGYVFLQVFHRRIAILFCIILCLVNIYLIRDEVGKIYKTSARRVAIVESWKSLYPTIPEKTIFVSQGDPLDFQSGFGQMLLVIYRVTPLLSNYFLWGIHEEGYKEEKNRGFGYFKDLKQALKKYCEHSLSPHSFFVASWNEKTQTLTDVSNVYKKYLSCTEE